MSFETLLNVYRENTKDTYVEMWGDKKNLNGSKVSTFHLKW